MNNEITISLNGNKIKKDNKVTKTLNIETYLWEQFNELCEKNDDINRTDCFNQLLKAGFKYLKEQEDKEYLYNSCVMKGVPLLEGQVLDIGEFFSICSFFSGSQLNFKELIDKKYFICEEDYSQSSEIKELSNNLNSKGVKKEYIKLHRIDFILKENNKVMVINIRNQILDKNSSKEIKEKIIKELEVNSKVNEEEIKAFYGLV